MEERLQYSCRLLLSLVSLLFTLRDNGLQTPPAISEVTFPALTLFRDDFTQPRQQRAGVAWALVRGGWVSAEPGGAVRAAAAQAGQAGAGESPAVCLGFGSGPRRCCQQR